MGFVKILGRKWLAEMTCIPMFVDDGVEGEAVSPACGEVTHVDVGVASCLHLTP